MSALLLFAAAVLTQTPAPNVPREVSVWVSRDTAPGPKIRLNINTRNVPIVHIDAFPVDAVAWLRRRDRDQSRPAPTGPAAKSWDATIATKGQAVNPQDNYFSRQVNLPLLKPGVYLLTVKGGGKEAHGVVNVTNLAVVVKRSPKKTLAWVTDAHTGAVVSGAEVSLYDNHGNLQEHAETGADGAATQPTPAADRAIVVRRGNDFAGVSTGATDPDGQLRAHFQTDRPIYRPGQTVSFKSILRVTKGQGYQAVVNRPVVVRLRDPRDNPLDEIKLTSTAMGSVGSAFKIPQEAMTGPYTLSLEVDGQTAYQTFTVAAYRKPEYKVDVAPAGKRYLAGETIRFKLNSAYYFGAPVPQAKVRWVVRASGLPFFTPDAEERWFYGGDGNLYPSDTYANSPFAGEGETITDNDGNAVIEVKSKADAPDQMYSIDITVEDASRRQVQGSSGVPVFAAAIRVGLTSPQQVTPLGGLIPVEVRTVNLDGKAVGAKARLRLVDQVWVEKEGRFKDQVLASQTVQVPPTGKAMTNFPAKVQGGLRVDVEVPDGTGRTAKAAMWAYVAGPDYRASREETSPQLNLKLDRRLYVPGQKVNAYITTNRPARPILVVVEGREIFAYRVLPAGKGGRNWSFGAGLEHSPNAWVTASEWTEGGLLGTTSILPVPDASRQISVEAIPDRKEVRPGDPMHMLVRTLDSKGKPIPAEVAVSVVDEAIYALSPDTTPDPYGFYWGQRQNQVGTTSSAPEEVSGGAYQRSNAAVPVRQRFEDTAYWNAFVTTGADGTATTEFEVPGNLTTWRTTARGVTLSTQVGTGRSSFLATRPLTLRLATPRLVAQGDQFTLIGTVNNRSSEATTVEVALEPEGIEVPKEPRRLDVPVHSERTVRWTLTASKVPQSGNFTLLARANGPTADLSDALKVTVPIVPRGVRETAQSAGTITRSATTALRLPNDVLSEGSYLSVRVFAGMAPALNQAADRVFASARYGSPVAADALIAASAAGSATHADDVKEAMALLSRTEHPDGWGWWENTPTDPVITARVGHALAVARVSGIRVFDRTWQAAQNAARMQYDRSNLWEHRAQLAATMVELGAPHAMEALQEVRERGIHLSPYSQIRMAQVLFNSDRGAAERMLNEVLKLVSDGSASAFIPVGEGIGWTASETETSAELLTTLAYMSLHDDLQQRLANRLALRQGWRSSDEDAAVARALAWYGKKHKAATSAGAVTVTVGDSKLSLIPSRVEPSASIDLPMSSLPTGPIKIERDGDGEAFYMVTLRYYRNVLTENATGVRVSRRFEVKNAAGVWSEVDRVIKPSEPVRCTVVVWGDDRSDAVRVTEPIPTGFEFVESEDTEYAQQDVRDGSVVHYLMNTGTPVFFRYYLRAESDGRLIALPAIAEYLRRPGQKGQSAATNLEVHP